MVAAFQYAVRYWRKVVYQAGGQAFATIGWHHPRNAILPLVVALLAAAWVGYETHDLEGFKSRAMIATASFGTLIAFFVLAFIWQMIATPPRLEAKRTEDFTTEMNGLKLKVESLAKSQSGPAQPSEAEKRLAIVHGHLRAHALNGRQVEDQDEMTAWMASAEDRVRGLVPKMVPRLYKAYPQPHRDAPELSRHDLLGLQKAIASLEVIDGTITADDLP
jgi:hypothetical protein